MRITPARAALAAAAFWLAGPALAGTWEPAQQLMGPFGISSPPGVPLLASNPQGRALLAWNPAGAVRLVERLPDGTWNTTVTLPGADAAAGTPALALGRNEVAAVAWSTVATRYTPSKMRVSLRLPGRAFDLPVEPAPGARAGPMMLAVACSGTVTLVWQDAAGLATTELPGVPGSGDCNGLPGPGPWTAVQRLSAGPVSLPALAANDAGAALLVWQGGAPGTPTSIVAAQRAAGEGWAPPVTLSAPTAVSTWNPKPALDAAGNAAVGWLDNRRMVVARRAAAGTWQPPVVLSGRQVVSYPALAMSARGDLLAAWQTLDRSGYGALWQRRATPGAAFGATTRVSTPAENASWPSAALSADGTLAVLGWVDSSSNGARVAVGTAGGWVQSTLGGGWWNGAVPVATGGGGAVAAWTRPNGANVNAVLLMGSSWK